MAQRKAEATAKTEAVAELSSAKEEIEVSRGLQLQSLWRIPNVAVS